MNYSDTNFSDKPNPLPNKGKESPSSSAYPYFPLFILKSVI